MKKSLYVLLTLLVIASGYVGLAHFSGGAFPTLGLPIGGERAALRKLGMSFLEDITFKDFDKAASYHTQELRDSVDIPFVIQRLFQVKPEALDFMHYEVVLAELDDSGLRGRVKMRIKVKILVNDKIEEKHLMLYFQRDGVGAPWHMKLEDSLRRIKAEKGKKS